MDTVEGLSDNVDTSSDMNLDVGAARANNSTSIARAEEGKNVAPGERFGGAAPPE